MALSGNHEEGFVAISIRFACRAELPFSVSVNEEYNSFFVVVISLSSPAEMLSDRDKRQSLELIALMALLRNLQKLLIFHVSTNCKKKRRRSRRRCKSDMTTTGRGIKFLRGNYEAITWRTRPRRIITKCKWTPIRFRLSGFFSPLAVFINHIVVAWW